MLIPYCSGIFFTFEARNWFVNLAIVVMIVYIELIALYALQRFLFITGTQVANHKA